MTDKKTQSLAERIYSALQEATAVALESDEPSAAWGTVALNLLKADGHLEYVRSQVLDEIAAGESGSDDTKDLPFASPDSAEVHDPFDRPGE